MCPSGRSVASETESHAPSCFRSAFEIIDADRDGKIGPDDLRRFYGVAADESAIETMISAADSNRNGFVEFDEFQIAALHGGADADAAIMKEVFKAIDRDGDGKLGREDLRDYMSLAGFSLSDDDVDAMIALAKEDGGDGVTYQGLLKILAVA